MTTYLIRRTFQGSFVLLVAATLVAGVFTVSGIALSFLGLGIIRPTPSRANILTLPGDSLRDRRGLRLKM